MRKVLKRMLQIILATLIGAILVVFIGASCVQDIATPTYINESAAEWANVPTKIFMPYTSLWDAKRVARAIDYKITVEKIKGGYYKNITNISILAGEELKSVVFDANGVLPLLMVGGPMCALGAFGFSKPADKKKIEELKNGNK